MNVIYRYRFHRRKMEETSGGLTNNVSEDNMVNSDNLKSPQSNSSELSETMAIVLEGKTMEEKVAYYVQREKQLLQKLSQNEENFGQKRAKFMEMYMQVFIMQPVWVC